MTLTELEPRWVASRWERHPDTIFGVTFRCPHCSSRLGVLFANPIGQINEQGPIWAVPTGLKWQRTGESLETLSLTPSINVEGHWHGFITNGGITE